MPYHTGEQLGNYRLLRLLGRGGFAEVYLGEHLHIHRQAAIKVLHARLAESAIAHFQQEAQIIADLGHPHIVTMFDFDLHENVPFLVMDYYPQGSLRQRHPKRTRLSLEVVVDYVSQLADALDFAHEKRIIHRDVKPENMLIDPQGKIVLTDFGIAAIAHSTTSMSQQVFAGTPYYMAPEQIQSYARPASDQYALATVVYEWLTGTPPFQGTVQEIYLKQLLAEPPPLRERLPNLSPAVEQVVLTALHKDPQQRFVTVTAFATALAAASRQEASLVQTLAPVAAEQRGQSEISVHQNVFSTRRMEESVTGGQNNQQGSSAPPAPVALAATAEVAPQGIQGVRKRAGKPLALVALVLVFLLLGGGIFLDVMHWGPTLLQGKTHATPLATTGALAARTATVHVQATGTAALAMAHPYPAYLPGHGHLAWYDPMESGVNWESGANRDKTGYCAFTNSAYHTTQNVKGFRWCADLASGTKSDFAFEIHMTIVKGDCGGIVFRENTQTLAAYMFTMCQWGQQDLYTYIPDRGMQYLVGNSQDAVVHRGLNQDNVLAVMAQGSQLTLFINGRQVGQIQDTSNTTGYLCTAAVDQNTSTDVTFRDATIWTF